MVPIDHAIELPLLDWVEFLEDEVDLGHGGAVILRPAWASSDVALAEVATLSSSSFCGKHSFLTGVRPTPGGRGPAEEGDPH
jgi:hypothetical protein